MCREDEQALPVSGLQAAVCSVHFLFGSQGAAVQAAGQDRPYLPVHYFASTLLVS